MPISLTIFLVQILAKGIISSFVVQYSSFRHAFKERYFFMLQLVLQSCT